MAQVMWQAIALSVMALLWLIRQLSGWRQPADAAAAISNVRIRVRIRVSARDFFGAALVLGSLPVVAWVPNREDAQVIFLLMLAVGIALLAWSRFDALTTEATTPKTGAPEGPPVIVYVISLPRSTPWNSEQAIRFVDQLLTAFPQLIFRIYANAYHIGWQVIEAGYAVDPAILERMILANYPQAEIEIVELIPGAFETPFCRVTIAYEQVNFFVAPIQYADAIKTGQSQFDPLNAFSQAMNGLQEGEQVIYTLVNLGMSRDAHRRGQRLVTTSTIHPLQWASVKGARFALQRKLAGIDRTTKYVARDQRVLEEKLGQKLYDCALLLQIDAPTSERLVELLVALDAQFSHFANLPYNVIQCRDPHIETRISEVTTQGQLERTQSLTQAVELVRGIRDRRYRPPQMILEPRELATLWHLPHDGFRASRIFWDSGLIPMPEDVMSVADGTHIGNGRYDARLHIVLVPKADRATHMTIVGKTGTGKSTLMHSLIHQDIAEGEGVVVIDPHGQLIQNILRTSIPAGREGDVVLLDLANSAYPPPLNPLRGALSYTGTLRIVGLVERLFEGTESAARMSSYLRAALIPLRNQPQATMRDVARMFMDDAFRESVLARVDDLEVQDFWDYQYARSSPALQRQIAEPILNRIRPFYANPHLYPVLCHPDTLDFAAFLRERKVVLISLAMAEESVPKQERDLVGALLISQLQIASMGETRSKPTYLYVDEVQRFVTTSLSDLLSEARKYGVSLTTANQYLGQLTEGTLEAILGNVGTTVILPCSPDDGQALAAYTKPQFDAQALIGLDRFTAAVKLQIDGQSQPAFSIYTPEPLEVPEDGDTRAARIRERSLATYTPKSREAVLEWLRKQYPRQAVQQQLDVADEAETFFE